MVKTLEYPETKAMDDAICARYDSRLYFIMDRMASRKAAYDEGFAGGFARSFAGGKIEAARNLLEMSLTVEQIAQGTGLSVEEVQELRKGTEQNASIS